MTPRRVYLVDDDVAVRAAITGLLETCGFSVRAFPSGETFLEAIERQEEGCVLLDLRMPGLSGLEVQEELGRRGVFLPVIFLTAHGDVPTSVVAVKAGASDFLLKPVDDKVLLTALEQTFAQLEASAGSRADVRAFRTRAELLTPREHEVMDLVAQGLGSRAIATRLGIALPTVKVHRMRGMQKLKVGSIARLGSLWAAMQRDADVSASWP